jgi:tight adherence protein C
VIGALLLGGGLGAGLLVIAAGLVPRRPRLAEALAALTRPLAPPPIIAPEPGGWAARFGRPAVTILAALGLPTPGIRRDLALLGRAPERLLAEQATTALAGILLPPVFTGLLAAGGLPLGWQIPAAGALFLGAAGFVLPPFAVRSEAARRRAAFRQALAAYLDLIVISLAGGAGIEAALTYSAAAGTGWAFSRLRAALEAAQLTRRPPWQTLAQLGADLGIGELTELAASVTLAGTEGARIRISLAAKAAGLRSRQLADAETSAQAATERMSLPLVLLFAGFLLLIGYPAVVHVLTGL